MGKLLSWVLLIAVVYAVMRLVVVLQRKAQRAAANRPSDAASSVPAADAGAGERMLPCSHCGVHAPASEMIPARGRHYCCPEHRDADAA